MIIIFSLYLHFLRLRFPYFLLLISIFRFFCLLSVRSGFLHLNLCARFFSALSSGFRFEAMNDKQAKKEVLRNN